MKQATSNNLYSKGITQYFNQRLREGLMIITAALALFFFLSLLTHHQADLGWSSTGDSVSVANAGGRVGAWLADFLLCLFGYSAYLIPFIATYCSYCLFSAVADQPLFNLHMLILRISGFLLLLVGSSGLESLYLVGQNAVASFGAGGILGTIVGPGLEGMFNRTGTSVLLLSLFCSGVTLLTGISWILLAEGVGSIILKISSMFSHFIVLWKTFKALRQKAQLTLKVQQEALPSLKVEIKNPKERIPPRVEPKVTEIMTPVKRLKAAAEITIENNVDGNTELPPLSLLDQADHSNTKQYSHEMLEHMSREVENRLQDFGIEVQVVAVHPGPVVTRFEMQLAPGIKVSRISTLAKDLARSLSVVSVRVVEVIAGKSVVGLELPNESREVVFLSEVLASQQYIQARSPLALVLGKDIAGHPVIVDLAKMPHLLVAGTTGSGKSVGLNAMLMSLLYKSTPKDVRLIMVDPKMLELSVYEGIPHLLTPVVTDMKEAANALRWCVAEMERRYRVMASLGVRNLAGYNQRIEEANANGSPLPDPFWQAESGEDCQMLQTLPFIVVLIDEYADMMMVVGKKVEELIARIAQKARAAGIHLILATQRPSVDVVTGLIKANIPTRIAYQVSSKIDSRTVLDQSGAEQLLGHGDMLYLPPGTSIPVRVHGAFVGDHEVHKAVKHWKMRSRPDYIAEITAGDLDGGSEASSLGNADMDPLYDQAVEIVTTSRRASISNIQRRLKIGYNRAARLIEDMEREGIVTSMESNGNREVLAPPPVEV
ncbi:DNA translocase FtsK [soil metagenome]